MRPKDIFVLLKDTFKAWSEDKASRLGAALAYYAIFAIGPLLLVIIAIVGFVFGEEAAQGQIAGSIGGVVGPDGAETIEGIVENAGNTGTGIVATVVGALLLMMSAAGIFGQLQDALNTIWGVAAKKGGGIVAMLKARGLTFLMVLGMGLILIASLAVNAVLAALGDTLTDVIPGGPLIWQLVNYAVSLAVMVLIFATIFKVLPDVRIGWKDVWVGALVSAVLFILGQIALGFYFGMSDVGSPFGAAGSLVSILVWIYYSAQILFFGAEFTQVYADRYGSSVEPSAHAEFVSSEMRARQGMKKKRESKRERELRPTAERRPSPWFS